MTSRLDRLFVLLDQGTTPLIRKAAANQLGEIQKLYPNEFDTLLLRLKKYLFSNSWDTRIAANQAIESIIKNINWQLIEDKSCNNKLDYNKHKTIINLNENRFCLENYCLELVIENGKNLFASLKNEHNNVFKILGLKEPDQINLKLINQFIETKDDIKKEINDDEYLNNQNKRLLNNDSSEFNFNKRIKLEQQDNINEKQNYSEWPLLEFANELKNELFNLKWEIRHGSAIALRDLIKFHGKNAGRIDNLECVETNNLNQIWLIDLALRLITVLALDKFGDYLTDQVVAPVRETCAQALGSIFNLIDFDLIKQLLDKLIKLLERNEWEARHGSLLSLKYLLAIRLDLSNKLLPIVFEPIFNCLNDNVDDVSAVAASSLVPVKDKLFEILPDKVPLVIDFLWESLVNIDELTSSTSNILILLSSLLAQQVDRDNLKLNNLIPRLWPFLDHTLTIVRKSVLDAFIILINSDDISWLTVELLSDSLRLIFQRILVEDSIEIQSKLSNAWSLLITKSPLDNLLNATCLYLSSWLCLLMQPARIQLQSNPIWFNIKQQNNDDLKNYNSSKCYFIGGTDLASCSSSIKEESITNARLNGCKFLGLISFYLVKCKTTEPPSSLESICGFLEFHLNSKSAVQRMCVCWIVEEWAKISKDKNETLNLQSSLIDKFSSCLQEFIFFDEIGSLFTRVQHEFKDFINQLKINKFNLEDTTFKTSSVYTFQQIGELLDDIFPNLIKNSKIKLKPKILENLEERRRNLSKLLEYLNKQQTNLSITVTASLSCALIAYNHMPEKLNPIIRPIMESIKKEENDNLQLISAQHLTYLIEICYIKQNTQPVPKIIKNLINFLCMDVNFTPEIIKEPITLEENESTANKNQPTTSTTANQFDYQSTDIIALLNIKKLYESKTIRKQNSAVSKLVGDDLIDNIQIEDNSIKSSELFRRGASFALIEMFKYFKDELPIKVEPLWESIMVIKELIDSTNLDLESAQKLLQSLQLLEIIIPFILINLKEKFIELLIYLKKCLECKYTQIRHLASRCLAAFANNDLLFNDTIDLILTKVLELLESAECSIKRQGAIETFYYLVEKLSIKIVPYIVLIVVPMMGRMSDQNDSVRILATQCFAQLVRLMPLDNTKKNDDLIGNKFLDKKRQQYEFLEQLLNPKRLNEYKLPIPINVQLRSYQQEGINYLAFLNKYQLHGILADEMGLGKTLMSICMVAADHHYRLEENKSELPSLVICPSTLTGHWYFERVDEKYLKPIDYSKLRYSKNLKKNLNDNKEHNLVIASYDIVRNDINFFSSINWNYCILDEGHIIKNGKTKLSKAIKSIQSNHRLILTGTPIQNNVLELWSLFDFLMPSYLGTERQFSIKYSKPILATKDSKSSSKEQETSVFAMESLHACVLPFILRRLKNDVLKDLPPKIIQDYYCELSPLQSKLYEDFAKSNAIQTIEQTVDKSIKNEKESSSSKDKNHIFQALQYLRKVCNHPKLVLESNHPDYKNVIKTLKEQNSDLSDIKNSAKLNALKQLLLDCGIGLQSDTINALDEPIVSQHRALIFFQMKSMLEIVQNDLLNKEMPSVTYLRLDGSIPASNRHEIVNKFNNDLSIDVLLLTTHVGGLGLNLTGADTVIFVEHDWNPQKDLQAMDRAHRLGQKKVVNVYRLITNGTLEEKIMGLQKFKLQIANTVISQENSNLQTMCTEQLLDLFQYENKQDKKIVDDQEISGNNKDEEKKSTSIKTLLEDLPEIWTESQYENEYDLTEFINSLKK